MTEILTEGVGRVERTADRAELDVTFSVTAPTRAEAVTALGPRLAVLADPAVADLVRNRRLFVQDEWRGKKRVGCRAGEQVRLEIPQVERLEGALAALLAAEPTDVSGPHWSLRDQAEARREAQRLAVADARDRAEGYSAALGAVLGPLLRLAETPHGTPQSLGMRTAAYAAGGPPDVRELGLEPELVRVEVRCSAAWELAGP